MKKTYNSPLIFNAFKPPRVTSYDVIRHFKRHLPKGYGKIGHFGTLDPFACGVLMVGVNGAAKLNDFIHDFLPKTYIAVGKLGVETATGDLTEKAIQIDDSQYLKEKIAALDIEFLEKFIQEHFLGEYWQAPHKYSAAKFKGKSLHKWAREGVEIEKEKKCRTIYSIQVIKYSFPYLILRCEVSSGTYIRSLFSDIAKKLNTIGTLVSLVRESVGPCSLDNTIAKRDWPNGEEWDFEPFAMRIEDVLPFGDILFDDKEATLYSNGVQLKLDRAQKMISSPMSDIYFWVKNLEGQILGLGRVEDEVIHTQFNFSSNS